MNIHEIIDGQRSTQGAVTTAEYVIGIECDDSSALLNYMGDGTPTRYQSFISAVTRAEILATAHPQFRYYVRCATVPGSKKQYLPRAKFEAEKETIGETMAELDLSSEEWEAIPTSVQRRLIARVFRTRKSPSELAAERGQV